MSFWEYHYFLIKWSKRDISCSVTPFKMLMVIYWMESVDATYFSCFRKVQNEYSMFSYLKSDSHLPKIF